MRMIQYTGSDLVPYIGGEQYDDVKGRQSFVRYNYIGEYSPVQWNLSQSMLLPSKIGI